MNWLYRLVNVEAEAEYRYQPDRYEFARKHLHMWRFQPWSKAAYYAFGKDIYYG